MRALILSEAKKRGCELCTNYMVCLHPGEKREKGKLNHTTHAHCALDSCPYEELNDIKRDFRIEYDRKIEKDFKAGMKRLRANEERSRDSEIQET